MFLLLQSAHATPVRHEIAFIENNLTDYQTLVAGTKQRGMEVVVLDSHQDGLAQMAEWLAQKAPGSVDAIHLLSHGSSGAINLGGMTLSNSNLQQHSDTLTRISNALTPDGDFLVYGCNVAEGQAGRDFVRKLAQATGANVGASDDLTGSSQLGGDWILESVLALNGAYSTPSIFIPNYTYVLDTVDLTSYGTSASPKTWNGTPGSDRFSISTTNDNHYWYSQGNATNKGVGLEDEINTYNTITNFQASTDSFDFSYVLSSFDLATITFEAQPEFLSVDNTYKRPKVITNVIIVTPAKATAGEASTIATSGTDGTFVNVVDNDYNWYNFFLPGVIYTDLTINNFFPSTNTAPTLTATGATPTFTQGSGTGVDLFSAVIANTNDSGQTFIGAKFTVTNVADTTEYLTIGGVDVPLINSGTASLTGLGASPGSATATVAVSAGTATVTITSLSRTNAEMGTLIAGVSYKNSDSTATTGNRVITLTEVTDSGSSSATASLSGVVATVTVAVAANHVVTFNSNGGMGSMAAQTANASTALTANSFTRSGYSFAGWNTVAGGGGTAYPDSAVYAFTADITLYAQWTALPTKTVTFNNNGGTGSMAAQTANASTALTANSFTRSGYSFAGWNTVAGGGGTAYPDSASYAFTADITLYAQWTAVSLTAQTIGAIGFSPSAVVVNQTSTASATATSNLTVSFSSLTPSICTVSGSTVTGVAAGVCTIAANQAGDATYGVAPQVTQRITVAATANAVHLTHGSSTTHYTTIQQAVDAAVDGDTISLDAGTFVEQVTVTKVITLQGAGIDQTIIRAPASASLTQSGGNWKNLKDQDIYAVVGIKTSAAGTTLVKNLTVDGNDQGFLNTQYPSAAFSTYEYTYDFEGIGVFNSNATIDTVKVTGVRALSTSFGNAVPAGYQPQVQPAGNNHNAGIFAESTASAGSHTLTVQNSTITKYQRTGVLAWGPTLTVDINKNTFQGYGQTYYSRGNAIQIAGTDRTSYGGANGDRRGTMGSITNNQILNIGIVIPAPGQTGSYLDRDYGAPSGVVLWQAGSGVQISGNTMTGPASPSWHNSTTSNDGGWGNSGIDVYASVNAVANNNTISGFDVGIVEEGTVAGSHFSASGNTFANNGIDVWSASGGDQLVLGSGAEVIAFRQMGNGIDSITGFGAGDKINVIGFATDSVNGQIGSQRVYVTDVNGTSVTNGYTDGRPVVDFTGGSVSMGNGSNVAAKSVQLAVSGGNTTLYIDTDGVAGAAELHITLVGTYTPSNFILSGGYISYATGLGAPTIMGITPGNAQLSVDFTAGTTGGSVITNYEYSTDGGITFTAVSPAATSSPIVITGLTNGTAYQVQIRAVNAVGAGVATASTTATPNPVVDGTCGPADGVAIAYAPAGAGLCTVGSASAVTPNASSWNWTCMSSGGGNQALCAAPKTQTATGTGAGSLEITTSSGQAAWQVQSANFVSVASTSSSSAPAGYSFPHGLLDLKLNSGTAGTSATVTITYPTELPTGTVYWKFGKKTANAVAEWYQMPADKVEISQDRFSIKLTLTDGALGDDDWNQNSLIVDPGGPGAPLAAGGAVGIPTLAQWGQIMLSALLVLLGLVWLRRRNAAMPSW